MSLSPSLLSPLGVVVWQACLCSGVCIKFLLVKLLYIKRYIANSAQVMSPSPMALYI